MYNYGCCPGPGPVPYGFPGAYGYPPVVAGGSGIWFAVLIILFIILLIFGGYWYFCNCT